MNSDDDDIDTSSGAATRRRGGALEGAVLQSAWEILTTGGYDAMTMTAVAHRANTSKSVLYRRWSNRHELLVAALRWKLRALPLNIPDTGNIRDDTLALLRQLNATPERFLSLLPATIDPGLRSEGLTPARLRELALGDQPTSINVLVDRAVERGEIDSVAADGLIRTLPIDVLRARLSLTMQPLQDSMLVGIVDELFMPLITRSSRARNIAHRSDCGTASRNHLDH